MPLKSLFALVEQLRERIDAHGDALTQYEVLTRYALIDPLLRELGWDTADPGQVVPEYQSGEGKPDYALLAGASPAIMVEAKKLGTPLRDKVLSQGFRYCLEKGTKHFSVTDGQRWEVYETHKPVPIDEKRIVSFDLKEQSTADVCLQALALWRPAVEAGRVAAGNPPIIEAQEPSTAKETSTAYSIPPQPGAGDSDERATPQPPIAPRPPSDGQSLATLEPTPGDLPPDQLTFPDGSTVSIQNWKQVLIESTRWLVGKGILNVGDCPIRYSSRARRYVVHTMPVHLDGKPFRESAREQIGPFHIDTHHSASSTMQVTKAVIERLGQDPAQFKISSD